MSLQDNTWLFATCPNRTNAFLKRFEKSDIESWRNPFEVAKDDSRRITMTHSDDVVSDNSQLVDRPSKVKAWLAELRLPFLTASIVPVILGTAVAWGLHGIILWDMFLLTVVAGCCLHIGANVSNDYFDHTSDETGSDDINVEFIRPFSGGSRMIQLGYLSPREVLFGSFVFFAIAGIIGIYLALNRGFLLLVLGAIGVFSGFFYTAPPFRFVHRGIGEFFIGLNFGVLMVLGAYFVQVQIIDLEALVASLPVALLISAILYINEFPDLRADEAAGKRTLVVRLGFRRASYGYGAFIAAVYIVIVVGVLFDLTRWTTIIALVILPLSVFSVRHTLKKFDRPFELVPANAATIMIHLLTGIFLSVSYILYGFATPPEFVLVVAVLCLILVWMAYRKVTSPPPGVGASES
ncbi:MAG: 1,4-dihydroxy-2-naphthoate octaprenyltransferase [Candidatus Thorarchaeota archaeon]|jgi:1,4-dihydroxy-2-naphthoate octaprenyltransferase